MKTRVRTAFIFHGIYGNPSENWFPWLKQELEKIGFEVLVPHFPTKEDLHLKDWWDAFEQYEKKLSPDSILIGHSVGCAFLLKVQRAETLAKHLQTQVTLISGAGHFNEKAGYRKFPLLLQEIRKAMRHIDASKA